MQAVFFKRFTDSTIRNLKQYLRSSHPHLYAAVGRTNAFHRLVSTERTVRLCPDLLRCFEICKFTFRNLKNEQELIVDTVLFCVLFLQYTRLSASSTN